jgi:hypothetical protein
MLDFYKCTGVEVTARMALAKLDGHVKQGEGWLTNQC